MVILFIVIGGDHTDTFQGSDGTSSVVFPGGLEFTGTRQAKDDLSAVTVTVNGNVIQSNDATYPHNVSISEIITDQLFVQVIFQEDAGGTQNLQASDTINY